MPSSLSIVAGFLDSGESANANIHTSMVRPRRHFPKVAIFLVCAAKVPPPAFGENRLFREFKPRGVLSSHARDTVYVGVLGRTERAPRVNTLYRGIRLITPPSVACAFLYKPLAYCVHVSSWQPLALHVGRFERFHPRVSFLLYQEDRYLTKLEYESPASPWAELSCSEESLLISYSMVPSESGGKKRAGVPQRDESVGEKQLLRRKHRRKLFIDTWYIPDA